VPNFQVDYLSSAYMELCMKNYTWYKLIGKIPHIDETNGQWFKQNRSLTKIASTELRTDVHVTTIFLCLSSSQDARPLLFETCVTGKAVPSAVRKFATYDEAIIGHKRLVEEMKIILSI